MSSHPAFTPAAAITALLFVAQQPSRRFSSSRSSHPGASLPPAAAIPALLFHPQQPSRRFLTIIEYYGLSRAGANLEPKKQYSVSLTLYTRIALTLYPRGGQRCPARGGRARPRRSRGKRLRVCVFGPIAPRNQGLAESADP